MSDTHPHAEPHAEPAAESEPERGGLRFLRDLVIIVVVALLASFLVKAYLVRSFYIPSASMQNTLLVGDRVLVNESFPGWCRCSVVTSWCSRTRAAGSAWARATT